MVAMGLPATASRGSAQLLPFFVVVFLLASLHFSGVKSLDVSPPASAPTSAPPPVAVASPFSFSFDFTNASTYSMEDLEFEGSASATVQDHLLDHHVDVTCSSYGKDPTHCTGWVSYAHPVPFYDNTTGELASFQTRFTFAIIVGLDNSTNYGDGMAFFLACYPSKLSPNSRGGNLGLINPGDDGKNQATFGDDRFVPVEFDTFGNNWDPSSDHIGIDINSVTSVNATMLPRSSLNGSMTATVTFDNTGRMLVAGLQFDDDKRNLPPVQVSWRLTDQLNTLLPPQVAVGFSAATGYAMELHQILSWSFNSSLAPPRPPRKDHDMKAVVFGGSIGGAVALVIVVWLLISCFKWTRTTSHDFVARTGGARRFE